jgi:hypothetical protein
MSYRAIVGFNYPDDTTPGAEIRVEEGTVLDSLPLAHAASILEQGCVEEIHENASQPKKREGK